MKVRMGSIAVLLFAIVAFAPSASACEKCKTDMWGVTRCDSGHASGHQSCYGGSGVACTLSGGSCPSGGDPNDPLHPDPLMSEPCLACEGDAPTQGFVLRPEPTASNLSAALD